MPKNDLDRLLENAVARAIGLKPPHANLRHTPRKRVTTQRHPVRHAA